MLGGTIDARRESGSTSGRRGIVLGRRMGAREIVNRVLARCSPVAVCACPAPLPNPSPTGRGALREEVWGLVSAE